MEKFINRFEIVINHQLNKNSDHGIFYFKPLKQGFGITIGNSLRRVLLSSINGHAIFAIKVAGFNHEFQALKGVRESLTEIILNLKKVVIKIDLDLFSVSEQNETPFEKWPTLKIDAKKPGVITANDIETPVGFSIVNKDVYIATLEDKSRLKIDIYAKTGYGYVSFEQNKEAVDEINLIATDSNFSPVLKVMPKVTEVKTKKNETSEQLELEVSTNGSISVVEAVAMASKILSSHFDIITNELYDNFSNLKVINDETQDTYVQQKNTLSSSIDELDLSVRSYNCLKRAGINTIIQLIEKTSGEIERIRNLGKKSYKEIISKVKERNLNFKDKV